VARESAKQSTGDQSEMPNLQLFLKRPRPVIARRITRSVGRTVDILAEVHATAVERPASASVKFDTRFVELVDGEKIVRLPRGTFRRSLSWKLKAMKEFDETWVGIFVGGRLAHSAGFPLRITLLKRV
jgi:hypothetical protein